MNVATEAAGPKSTAHSETEARELQGYVVHLTNSAESECVLFIVVVYTSIIISNMCVWSVCIV